MSKQRVLFLVLGFCVWVVLVSNALISNPSASKARLKLQIMKEEMSYLLERGGQVVRSDSNAKYGGAFLARDLSDSGWSDHLLRMYLETLEARGWKKVDANAMIYCKDDILLTITPNAGVLEGVGVNFVGMKYDAGTIRDCHNAQH